MTIFECGRLKCLHDLLLKKYHSIVLQLTFYQMQFKVRLFVTYSITQNIICSEM